MTDFTRFGKYTCTREVILLTVIYADLLFLINTIANYLLLLASAKICDVFTKRLRIAAAAVLGGIYSLFASVPQYAFLNALPSKLLCAAVLVLLTFGFHRSYLRLTVVFLSVSASLGGIVYAVSLGADGVFSTPGLNSLALSFLCTVGITASVFRRTGKQSAETRKIHVSCFGKSTEFTAFTDTGNNLKDPVTGAPAVIICLESLKTLLPRELYKLIENSSPANALEALSGTAHADKFRLLPYSAVGVKGGMLLALRADVKIDGKPSPKTLIALSPTEVSDGGAYSALIGI